MRQHLSARPAAQQGVVLIIALVMLVTISLLTTLSIRSAVSTESVSGNVRTTEMATQAAEIALRYCEEAVVQLGGGTVTLTATPTRLDYDTATFPRWNKPADTWDKSPTDVFVIPTAQRQRRRHRDGHLQAPARMPGGTHARRQRRRRAQLHLHIHHHRPGLRPRSARRRCRPQPAQGHRGVDAVNDRTSIGAHHVPPKTKHLAGALIALGMLQAAQAQMAQDPLLSRTAAVEPNIVS
jgi:hypothetical protein